MIREGLKNVAAGANPMVIRKGIEKAVEAAVNEFKRIAKPIEGKQSIAQVAAISSWMKSWTVDCRGDGKGRQRWRYHCGRIQRICH